MFDIPPQALPYLLDVLRKAAAGVYQRAAVDDYKKRRDLLDTIQNYEGDVSVRRRHAAIVASLQEAPPPPDHWYNLAVQHGLIDAETSLPNDLGYALLEMHQTSQTPGENADDSPKEPDKSKGSDVSLDARALAMFIEHPDRTKKQIAKHLVLLRAVLERPCNSAHLKDLRRGFR
jgi:hypothetical protein